MPDWLSLSDLPDPRADGLAVVVAATIRYEAASYDLDQATLAQIVGRSPSAVSLRMTGKVAWRLDEVGIVAAAMALRPGYLVDADPRTGRAPE